jgi:hypothetical protein
MNGDDDRRLHRETEAVAYALWLDEGRPDGCAQRHWDAAREIVALREAGGGPLLPIGEGGEPAEPTLAAENQAVAPGLTDQEDANPVPHR